MLTMGFPKLIGFCKECGHNVYDIDEIEGRDGIFECTKCGYPHTLSDLWYEKPDYLKSK